MVERDARMVWLLKICFEDRHRCAKMRLLNDPLLRLSVTEVVLSEAPVIPASIIGAFVVNYMRRGISQTASED
jgi:hypothetical protein